MNKILACLYNLKTANRFVSFFVCLIVANIAQAQQQSILALSKADHTLSIVDPTSLQVLARIPVGEDPHEVIASSDGKIAYVTIYGGGSLHEINVIDLVGKKP